MTQAELAALADLERLRDGLAAAGVPVPAELLHRIEGLRAGQAVATAAPVPRIAGSVQVGQAHQGAVAIGVVHGDVVVGAAQGAARDEAREREALRAYRRFVLLGCERISTRLIEREQNDPAHPADAPALANVYVALDTTATTAATENEGDEGGEEDRGAALRRLSVLEVFAREQRVALVGHAGYGKSTVLAHTALCLAMDGLDPAGKWGERIAALGLRGENRVPVAVALRDLAASLPAELPPPTGLTIQRFWEARLRDEGYEAAIAPVARALEKGQAILLLDGLDEVPVSEGRDLRAYVRQAIEKLAERYPSCRVVVSCRVLTYEEDGPLRRFFRAELAPLDGEKRKSFVQAWYAELARVRPGLAGAEAARLASRLLEAVEASRDLQEMAQSPLLLTVMAVVHATLGELPDAEAELYREAVDILLWRWGQVRGQSPKDLLDGVKKQKIDLLVALRQLAYDVHARTPVQAGTAPDIPARELVAAFQRLDPRRSEVWAEELLASVQHRAGLLLPAGQGSYRFPHRTYQELLAGWHLVHQPDFPQRAARLLREDATRWQKVVLFGVGLLVRDGNLASLPHLLVELCPRSPADTDEAWRQAWRAGEVLHEVKPERLGETELGREVVARVRDRLRALVEGGHLAARERVEAARVLGRVGDPRFREDAWGLPAEEMLGFVRIPAGPFWMGSDKVDEAVDEEAWEDELPRHEITLPEVWMARYPVTEGQWRAFARASNWRPHHEEEPAGIDNEPVGLVTWRDAVAYAQWIDQELRAWPDCPGQLRILFEGGYRVVLPSEAEWEKAARGTGGRLWPWGNTFEDTCANTMHLGLRDVSPVGCFPSGATPEGVLDMAGNVWEWTRSVWASYPWLPGDGRDGTSWSESRRALRGGSFADPRAGVRCPCRIDRGPDLWSRLVGFRLSLSPLRS